jgi:hypothetical protein
MHPAHPLFRVFYSGSMRMLDYGARGVISHPTLLLWGDSDNIHVPFSTTDDHRACCMHAPSLIAILCCYL